ncbi:MULTISPECIES: NB-ARC domain-containing protein [unclassified Bradyrhizobium]|uniref:NB-ARC domain-containing protein n=1 Tax=unclassified Bradyrhizobium TaxID=2631580 RepID=UPI002FF11D80
MAFAPIDRVVSRAERNSDSDFTLFMELLYVGELIVKITTAAFVACIENDREGHRYQLLHALVRADGIGEWASKLEEALVGPATQHLASELVSDRRIFTERLGEDSWQYQAVRQLSTVLIGIHPTAQPIGDKVSLRTWFSTFAELRNKTRGHGAITPATCAKVVAAFRSSIDLVISNNPIFQRSWAYLHRNLSGKYNVVMIGGDTVAFRGLTTNAALGENLANGVYISANRLRPVELIQSDVSLSDFFLPNGAFNGKSYELHSLITDSRLTGDARPYLAVANNRPPSETEGTRELDVLGEVFTNLPSVPSGYVRRPRLEAEASSIIANDRHAIVTLVGRGGTGKTSLVLAILHEMASTGRYQAIVWFSARDIDLTSEGPKVVQPRVMAEKDIAAEYVSLVGGLDSDLSAKKSAVTIMAEHMRSCPIGPTLFVFDNFETVRNPVDLFQWIDANIRLPNKVLITSRFREFKADFPIEVSGMEPQEAENLIAQTAQKLGISHLISSKHRDQIIEESNGHPYIIKIILGEVANTHSFSKPSSMMVRKDEILEALFERTYANLSPLAVHTFLTLSGWRSLVPQLAVEAVLLRHHGGGTDPEHAIDELVRMSLVDRTRASDNTIFLVVPLAAALFGTKKLNVHPHRQLIESDVRFLQDIGATASTGLKEGIAPRMDALFKKVARRISEGTASFGEMRPILEYVARSYHPAWLLLAQINRECEGEDGIESTAGYLRRFLEKNPFAEESQQAWQQLIAIYRATGNVIGGCSAFLRAAEIRDPPLHQIASMAHWLNSEREIIDRMSVVERGDLFKPIARLLESHLPVASATDLSRLAWLWLHAGDNERALRVAEIGLEREPDNRFCQSLVDKLK